MPVSTRWRRLAAGLLSVPALALAAAETPSRSALDAQLFYQLLIGEMQLRAGDVGTAYRAFLEAARRTGDAQLFRRAMDVALQARAGNEALAAVRAWREAHPRSAEPLRLELQILVALGQADEAGDAVAALLALTPEDERGGVIAALPRLFDRAPDKARTAELLQGALAPYLEVPATRTAAVVALGRAWLAAGDADRALALARQAALADPDAPGPVLLALELMPTRPAAERIVVDHLARPGSEPALRLAYVRILAGAARYADAIAQLETATRARPDDAAPYLTLGALHLELRQWDRAEAALQRYLSLTEPAPGSTTSGAPDATGAGTGGRAAAGNEEVAQADGGGDGRADGRPQAWLMLAQVAEQRGDYAAAERWLARIDDPQRALEVQSRRALMMARQGQVDAAVASLRQVPERRPDDARAKLVAEAQLLRDVGQWQAAYDAFTRAIERFADDVDLLYEQAMVAEKLDRLDLLEQRLRRVIELQPEHAHAHNALGYSLADRGLRLDEARQLIVRALELRPGDPFITDSLGWVEFRLGNLAEARRLLEQAWTTRPDTEIGAHLGEVLWVLGERDEARRIWRQAQSRDEANEVLRETLSRLQVSW